MSLDSQLFVYNGDDWDQLSNVSNATGGDVNLWCSTRKRIIITFLQPGSLTVTDELV